VIELYFLAVKIPSLPGLKAVEGNGSGMIATFPAAIGNSKKNSLSMQLTGTHFNYYFICHRKLWLFSQGIYMEQTSELVDEGRLIHETAYPRRSSKYQEVEMDGIKIDYFDPARKEIHEVKKSNKMEEAHRWQLKYYLYIMEKNGFEGLSGLLEYPVLHKTEKVFLSQPDREEIIVILKHIREITQSNTCPEKQKLSICRKCSYEDFCWSGEPNLK